MTDDAPTAKRPEVDRTEHHAALTAGVMIGRYRIESVLGLGGFGITYRCYDTHLRRDVAVKEYLPTGIAIRHESSTVLPRSTEMSTDFVWGRNRFLDEARTIAKLGHVPAVVRVHDFLEAFGTAYVVMELLTGETMSQRLKSEPRLAQATIERILPALLDGLEQIHTAGFLHRDIKPANIILGPGDTATLIDFGASRVAIADRSQALTAVFTPGYAAPEQSTSGKQGPWTDIYGLAATLFTAVTGKVPPSVMERVFEGATVLPAEAADDGYATSLLAGIDAGLRLPIEARPQSIAAWREILFAKETPVADGVPAATLPGTTQPSPPSLAVASSRRLRYGALAGAAVVALGVGYALFALTARDERTATAAAPAVATAAHGSTVHAPVPAPVLATAAPPPAPAAATANPATTAPQLVPATAATTTQASPTSATGATVAPPPLPPAPTSTAAPPPLSAPKPTPTLAPTAAPSPVPAATPAPTAVSPASSTAPSPLPAATPAPADPGASSPLSAATPAPDADSPPAPPPLPPSPRAPAAVTLPDPGPAPAPTPSPSATRTAASTPLPPASEPVATTTPALDEPKVQDADSRAIEEVQSRRDRPAQEAARPEEPRKSEEQLKAEAEQAESALKLGTRDRQKIQVALTSLGFDTGWADGVFGPRSRRMIADWQSANGEPPTGFISADNKATLLAKAAPAITRWEEAQRRAYLEEQRRLEELRRQPPPTPPQPRRTWRWPWEERFAP